MLFTLIFVVALAQSAWAGIDLSKPPQLPPQTPAPAATKAPVSASKPAAPPKPKVICKEMKDAERKMSQLEILRSFKNKIPISYKLEPLVPIDEKLGFDTWVGYVDLGRLTWKFGPQASVSGGASTDYQGTADTAPDGVPMIKIFNSSSLSLDASFDVCFGSCKKVFWFSTAPSFTFKAVERMWDEGADHASKWNYSAGGKQAISVLAAEESQSSDSANTFVGSMEIPAEAGVTITIVKVPPFSVDVKATVVGTVKRLSPSMVGSGWESLNNCLPYPTKLTYVVEGDLTATATLRGDRGWNVLNLGFAWVSLGLYVESDVLNYRSHFSP